MGRVQIEPGVFLDYNDEWSFKDRTNYPFSDIPNGTVVYASYFGRETPDTHCFPEDMNDVTFVCCNLDNCHIPNQEE